MSLKLTCHPYRFATEPIRILTAWKGLQLTEVTEDKAFPVVPILEHSDKKVEGIWEILDYLTQIDSHPNAKSTAAYQPDATLFQKIKSASLELIKNIFDSHTVLASAAPEEIKSKIDLIKPIIDTLTKEHEKSNFFQSEQATPLDLCLYEYYKLLESLAPQVLSGEIMKYVERVEALKFVRAFNANQENYMRNHSKTVQCFPQRFLSLFGDIIPQLCDFAMLEGILFKKKVSLGGQDQSLVNVHTPISLYPRKVLRKDYELLTRVQDRWNIMLNEMARDFEWCKDKLKIIIEADEFVRRNYEIKQKCLAYPHTQDKMVCIFRNDYMYHAEQSRWMQVEYNSIAISFGPIGDRVHRFHKQILGAHLDEQVPDLPNNEEMTLEGLYHAFRLYGNPKAKMLVVVSDDEVNVFDQRFIEYGMFKKGVTSLRMTFKEIYQKHRFNEADGKFYIGDDEIGLVYYRVGYTMEHYTSEEDWKIREIMELSQAIKCPSVDFILINFKIFQVFLAADENELARFVKDEQERKDIQKTFAEFHYMATPDDKNKMIERVLEAPSEYVLKPQLEGGGHNFYGDDIVPKLKELNDNEIKSYFLMERINPNPLIGYMAKNEKLEVTPSLAEIGIFGYVLSDKDKVIQAKTGGALMRTKTATSNEGGVASGYGVVDSIFLC